jgi:hypothetical protein
MPEIQVFDIVQRIGMFATLNYCLLLAKACEEQNVEPYIILSSPFYRSPARGKNWFAYYFGHNRIDPTERELASLKKRGKIIRIEGRNHINEFARGDASREIANEFSTFAEARRLFAKYFHIKPEVSARVDEFAASNFDPAGQLGMHFRGTDHHRESEFVDKRLMVDAAIEHFAAYESIFIATDEPQFADYVRSLLPGKRLLTYRAEPVEHHTRDSGDNYRKGLHAVIDCLLLARCQALIKTPSALSAWSKLFGPDLDLVLVGKPVGNAWKHVAPWYNLDGLGYVPESLLYRWDAASMAANRVVRIMAPPPEPASLATSL